jgi:hypothetical protein
MIVKISEAEVVMGVTRKLFKGVIEEWLENELQGKISEVRNELFQGRGMCDGMFCWDKL